MRVRWWVFSITVTIIVLSIFRVEGNPIPNDPGRGGAFAPLDDPKGVYLKKEFVNFTIIGEYAFVDAFYTFKNRNTTDTEIGIVLPFSQFRPTNVSISIDEKNVSYQWLVFDSENWASDYIEIYDFYSAISFNLTMSGLEEKEIRTKYLRRYLYPLGMVMLFKN